MKQLYLKPLFIALLTIVSLPSFSALKVDGIYYDFDKTWKSAEVTYGDDLHNYDRYRGTVSIPSSIKVKGYSSYTVYTVKYIGWNAFYHCTDLISVSIPNSVISIGENAFSDCTGLTSVTIPNSELYIGEFAFDGCSSLTSVTIPASVKSIGENAFRDCYFTSTSFINKSALTSSNSWGAIICDEETEDGLLIKDNIVVKCRKWATSVIIPESVTGIGNSAFSSCTRLTSVTITESVKSIGDYAFQNCSSLTSVSIPEGVTSIGSYAFDGCTYLTSVSIPEGVTSIGNEAFRNCTGLTSVTIPEGVTSIGNYAFYGCSGLTSITIPSSVTSIGDKAFYGCSNLTSITIPESVMSIGSSAFYGCYFASTSFINNSALTSSNSWGAIICDEETEDGLLIKDNVVVKCRKWATSVIIPESVTNIGSSAFQDCTGLTSVTIPKSVTSIGSYAFYRCTCLTSVTIPESVTSIGSYAFYGCTCLTSVTIPESVTSIGSYAFYDCYMNRINLPENLTIIYDGFNCVDSVFLGDNVTTVSGFNYKLFIKQNSRTHLTLWVNEKYRNKLYRKEDQKKIEPVEFTPTSLRLPTFDDLGLATLLSRTIVENGDTIQGNVLTGLNPDVSYDVRYYIKLKEANGEVVNKSGAITVKTSALSLTTLQPKVISPGNVIVAAESNLDDEEEKVGFEWRRSDWTDDFESNSGGAYLYEGKMEGYIRNLYTEKLWKFRPYYESNTGTRYYGEWVGLDPTNTSYFEPTVHTYAKIEVNGNAAQVKGYAMRGSDNVAQQGFMYWKQMAEVKAISGSDVTVPKDALTVEAKGTMMEAELTGLDFESTYYYVAFMTTSEGETFYGEMQSFQTGENPDGIGDILAASKEYSKATIVARYDLQGHRLTAPQRGVNLLRMSDGTVRKVLVK